ncbi:hypothetical protein AAFF_G00094890 [Aldrovandia affinis]|uniref:Uncharacterized protein n=1 Tax=Aldrovandia affinis TaxID=143900 RepID=A0AAD7RVV5_9TELE|nr:hypothetical protein AAFF_G00094890 [Aldrovandia affinis]
MLALVLAESAQQAAMLSQRRASGPPTPVSPSPAGPPGVPPPAPAPAPAPARPPCHAPSSTTPSPLAASPAEAHALAGGTKSPSVFFASDVIAGDGVTSPHGPSVPAPLPEYPPPAGALRESSPPWARCPSAAPTKRPAPPQPRPHPCPAAGHRAQRRGRPLQGGPQPSPAPAPPSGEALGGHTAPPPRPQRPPPTAPCPSSRALHGEPPGRRGALRHRPRPPPFHPLAETADEVPPQPPLPPRRASAHQLSYLYHHPKPEGAMEPPPAPTEAYYHHPRAVPTAGQSYHYHRPESVPLCTCPGPPNPTPRSSTAPAPTPATLPWGPSPSTPLSSPGPPLPRGDYPRGQSYGVLDGGAGYPTIRRVRSLHAGPMSRAELPLEDEAVYYQRPVYQYKAVYQAPPPPPSSQVDYHVTQLQPYFENGRVQYRYSPYSGPQPPDAQHYGVDPYGTLRLRQAHSFSGRHHHHHQQQPPHPPHSHPGRVAGSKASGGYHSCLSRHILPAPGKEHSFISRDMPPPAGAVYLAWDPEDSERLYLHSLQRDGHGRQQRTVGPVPSHRHLRSKSDPGKAALVAAEGKDGRYGVAVISQHPPRHQPSDSDASAYSDQERRYHGNGLGDKPGKHAGGGSWGSQHAQRQDGGRPNPYKGEPSDHKQGGRHRPENSECRGHPSRYERPDSDRHAGRVKAPAAGPEGDPQGGPFRGPAPPPKPERSQSVRERHHYPPTTTPDLLRTSPRTAPTGEATPPTSPTGSGLRLTTTTWTTITPWPSP